MLLFGEFEIAPDPVIAKDWAGTATKSCETPGPWEKMSHALVAIPIGARACRLLHRPRRSRTYASLGDQLDRVRPRTLSRRQSVGPARHAFCPAGAGAGCQGPDLPADGPAQPLGKEARLR